MVWGWISLEKDKMEPIDVVSCPQQCCYSVLVKIYGFTVEGDLESCIAELTKG